MTLMRTIPQLKRTLGEICGGKQGSMGDIDLKKLVVRCLARRHKTKVVVWWIKCGFQRVEQLERNVKAHSENSTRFRAVRAS